jgi:sugar-specific transcriptional regulator TrmB
MEGRMEGLELKEYEVVKKAFHKNRTASEIADWLDIPVEKVLSIIESIKKQGDN